MSNSLQPHRLQHTRLLCPSLSPGVCSDTCPLSRWCYLTISSSAAPFSFCLHSFPTSGSFRMSGLFASRCQSIRASASVSVLPMNSQSWFPLGLTGLISSQSKGLSGVSSPQCESIKSLVLSLLYGPVITSIYDHWQNHSFDHMGLCQQSEGSAF